MIYKADNTRHGFCRLFYLRGNMFDDRVYLQMRLSKALETDEKGNYIIECEASNENLDYDGQIVLQRALLDSKDYFLKNGVISYDHRHLHADPDDPNWTPEKYIIGEPIDVYSRGKHTFVKAKLYKSNPLVQEIVQKLKDGSTRLKTSVGGRKPQIVTEWDQRLGRIVEKVAKVQWDELAITFKPVNQTLEPVELSGMAFVKSLQAGFATDSAGMTGGQAMVRQDLEKKRKPHKMAVVMGFATGDLKDVKEAKQFLMNRGYSAEEADDILRSIVEGKETMSTEVRKMADNKLLKAFEDSLETLGKALKGNKAKAKEEEPDVEQPSFDDEFPPAPEGNEGEMPEGEEDEEKKKKKKADEEEGEEGEDNGEDEEYLEKCKTPPLRKSLYEEMEVSEGDLLEVTPFLEELTKSISRRLDALAARMDEVENLQKAIGASVHSTGHFLKALSEEPTPRKAVLNRQERIFKSADGQEVTMTRDEIMAKARDAAKTGRISLIDVGIIEERLNKGLPLSDADMRMLKSL
jgi:hypothetical protein